MEAQQDEMKVGQVNLQLGQGRAIPFLQITYRNKQHEIKSQSLSCRTLRESEPSSISLKKIMFHSKNVITY